MENIYIKIRKKKSKLKDICNGFVFVAVAVVGVVRAFKTFEAELLYN